MRVILPANIDGRHWVWCRETARGGGMVEGWEGGKAAHCPWLPGGTSPPFLFGLQPPILGANYAAPNCTDWETASAGSAWLKVTEPSRCEAETQTQG